MPKPKERAAEYIRESDEGLANSATIESQAKAVRSYCIKKEYIVTPEYHYREAISGYKTAYTDRPKLMQMLRDCEKGLIDVVVVSEIRALGRKQSEIFVVYDMLQKAGVRLETIQERFDESDMGRIILSRRAAFAEIERNQMVMRTERGKADRIANGNLPGHGSPPYGFLYVDTPEETSARLILNTTIIYVDSNGVEWSPVSVCQFIYENALRGVSIKQTALTLTRMGIPTPRRGQWWHTGTIFRILTNPLYKGEAVVNRWKKENGKTYLKPKEENIILAAGIVPQIVPRDMWDAIQEQLALNKTNSIRNTKEDEQGRGLLRAGFCHCGLCGRTMTIRYPKKNASYYRCQKRTGKEEKINNHDIFVLSDRVDRAAWAKACEIIKNPQIVRERVKEKREEIQPVSGLAEVKARIEELDQQFSNLLELAQSATTKDSISRLRVTLEDIERQKQDAQALLGDAEEMEAENEKVEEELRRFETWAALVRPMITDASYQPTYQEKRLAIRILGIHAVITPTSWGCKHAIEITFAPPKIMDALNGRVIQFPAN